MVSKVAKAIFMLILLCGAFTSASARYETITYAGRAIWYSPGISCQGSSGTCFTTVIWVDDAVWTCNCSVQPNVNQNAGFYADALGVGYAYTTVSLYEPMTGGVFLGYDIQPSSVPVSSVEELLSKYPGVE